MRWRSLRRASSKPWGFVISSKSSSGLFALEVFVILMALHVSHFLNFCNGLLFLTNSSFDILQIWHVHLQVYAFKTALQTRKSFETHHLKAGGWLGFLIRKYWIHHQKSNMLKFQVDGWDGHEDESKQKWTFLGWSYHPLFHPSLTFILMH